MSLPRLGMISIFNIIQSNKCVVTSHYVSWCWKIFACAYLLSVFLLQWNLFKSLAQFFSWLFSYYWVLTYFHILDKSPSVDVGFTNIFSQCVASINTVIIRTDVLDLEVQFIIFFFYGPYFLVLKLRNYTFIDFLYCFSVFI